MNRQDSRLQFDPKRSNLRSYAHGQLRLEQAKFGEWMVDNKSYVNFNGLASGDAGDRLIVESMTFATTSVSLT
jgi:hypothetical protein